MRREKRVRLGRRNKRAERVKAAARRLAAPSFQIVAAAYEQQESALRIPRADGTASMDPRERADVRQ